MKSVFVGSVTVLLIFSFTAFFVHIKQGFPNRIEGWVNLQEVPTVEKTFCHNDGLTFALIAAIS